MLEDTCIIGNVEDINNHSYVGAISLCGWVLRNQNGLRPPESLLVMNDSGNVLGKTKTFTKRADVAEAYHDIGLVHCGFEIFVEKKALADAEVLMIYSEDLPDKPLMPKIAITPEMRRYNPLGLW